MASEWNADLEADAERRQSQRFRVDDIQSLTLLAGARSYPCAVQDISRGGLRLTLEEPAPLASEVALEHPTAGLFRGRRMWSKGHQIGLYFDTPDTDLTQALRCVQMVMDG